MGIAGRDVKQVQERLGHSHAGFTLRTYVHVLDPGVGDAAFLDTAVSLRLELAPRSARGE